MIFNLLEEFGIIYLQIFLLIKLGYRKIIFKGSRGSRKTTLIVKWIIKDMVLDPQASAVVVMETKVQNSKATMREFDKWIQKYDETKWKGFAKQWVKVDSQIDKSFKYHNNYGWIQEIQFIGIDELAKAGGSPLPNNYFKYMFLEEPSNSKEQYGLDADAKAERYDNINTFKLTALRHFSNAKKLSHETEKRFKKRTKNLGLTELYALNPYNDRDPLLEKFNKFLPDNQARLEKKGYDFYINKEDKEVYMTSNYRLNKYLPRDWHIEMERIKRTNYDYWKIVGLGMTGRPSNTIYENILPFIDKNKGIRPPCSKYGYAGFKNFVIVLDVGNGGEGEMVIGLLGQKTTGSWVPLDRWGSKEWVKRNEFDVSKIVVELIKQIQIWENFYVHFSQVGMVKIIIDNDIWFEKVFMAVFQSVKWKTQFNAELFAKKYLSVWENELRPKIVKYLITTGHLEMYEELWPELIDQMRTTKAKENGKIIGGNDDHRQAFEMGVFAIASEWLTYKGDLGELFDKELLEFYKETKR